MAVELGTAPSEEESRCAWFSLKNKHDEVITSKEELQFALQHAGRNPTAKRVSRYWERHARQDKLSYQQFKLVLSKEPLASLDGLMVAFRRLDTNSDGYISAQELSALVTRRGQERMTEREVQEVMRSADQDGDGRLDYEEFCRMMLSAAEQSRSRCRQRAAPGGRAGDPPTTQPSVEPPAQLLLRLSTPISNDTQPGATQTSEQTPEQTSEETPEQTSEQTSEETPKQTSEETPEQTSDETSKQTSEETPKQTPKQTSEETPEQTSEETPEQTSEETPKQTSDETPKQTSDETPKQTSEQTEQTSEETPKQTSEEAAKQTSEPPVQSPSAEVPGPGSDEVPVARGGAGRLSSLSHQRLPPLAPPTAPSLASRSLTAIGHLEPTPLEPLPQARRGRGRSRRGGRGPGDLSSRSEAQVGSSPQPPARLALSQSSLARDEAPLQQTPSEPPAGRHGDRSPQPEATPDIPDSSFPLRTFPTPQLLEAPADVKDWNMISAKGCFYLSPVDGEEDPVIKSHQYKLKFLEKTALFLRIEPTKQVAVAVDVCLFVFKLDGDGDPTDLLAFSAQEVGGGGGRGCRLDLDAGDYALIPFSTGCWLKRGVELDEEGVDPVVREGSSVNLSEQCKEALGEVFNRIDLDDSGGVSRAEFDLFQECANDEACDDDTWEVIKENFEMRSEEEISLEGFLKLHEMTASDSEGGVEELCDILTAMGYDPYFKLRYACPYSLEIFSESCESELEIVDILPCHEMVHPSLGRLAAREGVAGQIRGRGNPDVTCHAHILPDWVTIVIDNKGSTAASVQMDCSHSSGTVHSRDSAVHVMEVEGEAAEVGYHLMKHRMDQGWAPHCIISFIVQ